MAVTIIGDAFIDIIVPIHKSAWGKMGVSYLKVRSGSR